MSRGVMVSEQRGYEINKGTTTIGKLCTSSLPLGMDSMYIQ